MNIQELKKKSSEQLITQAEELGIENASTLRKQEILFSILKKLALNIAKLVGDYIYDRSQKIYQITNGKIIDFVQ